MQACDNWSTEGDLADGRVSFAYAVAASLADKPSPTKRPIGKRQMSPKVGTTSPLAKVDHLTRGDGERLRAIRLQSLRESPDAFGTTFEEVASKPPEFWEQQLQQLATFVAIRNGHDVGIVRGAPHDQLRDAGYLISMWVAPGTRRQGIGSALVDALVDWARTQRLNHLFLDVAELNSPAIALYTSKGFAPNGKRGTLPPPREQIREIQLVMRL